MTHITLDQMSNYLSSGATLDDVISMIEMLQGYKEEVLGAIEEWSDLIPDSIAWNDQARRKQLKTIVTWLMRLGYAVRWGKLRDDRDTCIWQVVKNEQIGRLHWECDQFFIEGLPKPEESPNDADRFPECLSCWE